MALALAEVMFTPMGASVPTTRVWFSSASRESARSTMPSASRTRTRARTSWVSTSTRSLAIQGAVHVTEGP